MGVRYRAVYRDGKLLAEYEHGELTYLAPEYQAAKRSELSMPMVIRDIGEYVSPIDGSRITSRSAHRDHMRAHEVIEVGNDRMAPQVADHKGDTREIVDTVKRHIEEVANVSQETYDNHVREQQAEHAAVASLVTADA